MNYAGLSFGFLSAADYQPLYHSEFTDLTVFDTGGPQTFVIPTNPSCNGCADITFTITSDEEDAPQVPEPASLLLLGTGLIGAGVRRWRKRSA